MILPIRKRGPPITSYQEGQWLAGVPNGRLSQEMSIVQKPVDKDPIYKQNFAGKRGSEHIYWGFVTDRNAQ